MQSPLATHASAPRKPLVAACQKLVTSSQQQSKLLVTSSQCFRSNSFCAACTGLLAVLLTAFAAPAIADMPQKRDIAGVVLGAPAEQVISLLTSKMPGCSPTSRVYKTESDAHGPVASVEFNAGDDKESCTSSQTSGGKVDSWQVSFVHASVDATSPAYEIELTRDLVYAPGAVKARAPEFVQSLRSDFGAPTVVKLEPDKLINDINRIVSKASRIRPQPAYLLKLVWQAPAAAHAHGECPHGTCGDLSLEAEIRGIGPQNAKLDAIEPTSIRLVLRDETLYGHQLHWLVEQDKKAKDSARRF
jgi:hypothetical protein